MVITSDDGAEGKAREEWERLYRRFHRQLVTHVERLTDDRARAEDIAHEVFLAALVELKAGRTRPSWPWLRALGGRLVSTEHEMGLDDVIPTGLPIARLRAIDPTSDPDELAERLVAAFARLSTRDRLVLSLYHEERWSQAEIARLLGVQASSVASHLVRARRRLRRYLDEGRAGGFVLLGWLAAGRRRLAGLVHRAPVGTDETALVCRLLDRLQPVVGVMATSAATLSLTTVLAYGGGGGSPVDLETGRDRPASTAVAGSTADARSSPADTAAVERPFRPAAPTSGVRATLTPGLSAARGESTTAYTVAPGSAQAGKVAAAERSFEFGGAVGFECPSPEKRRTTQAVGCPLLEETARLVGAP